MKAPLSPDGLAQAFIIGDKFLGQAPSALVFGDNIFYGHDFGPLLASADQKVEGATVFAYHGWTLARTTACLKPVSSLPRWSGARA